MSFINYYIRFTNIETEDVEIQIQDLSTLEDPPGATVEIELEGKEDAVVLESVEQDDDKTKAIKGRRLTFGFNSGDYDVGGSDAVVDVDTFSDGDDGRFRVRLGTGTGPLSVPFLGNVVLDDNQEAFQPRPNPVQLRAGEGLGNLKDIELKDGEDIPLGHYTIIDFLVMILNRLTPLQDIHVVFNLYETDTDPVNSHAFLDTYVNALTFETDVDKREDCFTVLTKILEAFGCFITYDNDGWWVIRWDEYDAMGTSILTHRVANFTNDGGFSNYTLEDLTKRIAHDQDVLYEGFFMSFDSALRRYQRMAKSVTHTYKFEQPKEVPCNGTFSRGDEAAEQTYTASNISIAEFDPNTIILTTSPFPFLSVGESFTISGSVSNDGTYTVATYDIAGLSCVITVVESLVTEVPATATITYGLDRFEVDCWTLRKGVPGSYGTPGNEMGIVVHYDDNGVEDDRYLFLSPEPTHSSSSTNQTYAESQEIELHAKDKFEVSVNWRLEADAANGNNYNIMRIYLAGEDGSHWLLGNTTIADPTTPLKWWDTSNFTVNTAAGGIDIDFTLINEQEWQTQSIDDVPESPVDGKLYIWLHQINQTNIGGDDQTINYSDLRFTYIPLVGGTYRRVIGQQHKVTGDNDSRKEITHEMYLSDSPKKLFKGALKKFDGTNFVLTETWNDFITATYFTDVQLAKFIVFQWWNQFRKTRTVIETDVQGLDSGEATGIPGMIHRWGIQHGGQETKWFMLTSFRGMDFYKCGWQGVFVEMSDMDGDRVYTDTYEFKFIYGG